MSVRCPANFTARFNSPDGDYTVRFIASDEWSGVIDTTLAGIPMRWEVEVIKAGQDGTTSLSGMTTGSKDIWNDCYWFELIWADAPKEIRYWGNQIIWRTDAATPNA